MFLNLFKTVKQTKSQVILLTITSIYLFALLFFEHKKEQFGEKPFNILEISEESKLLSSNIDVGLHINSFPVFSFDKNDFLMDAVIWFKFKAGTESLETINKFNFQNGEIKFKSEPSIRLIEDQVLVSYHVKVDIKTTISYKDFPLADHNITIVVDNRSVTPNELSFNSCKDNFTFSPNMLSSSWINTKKNIKTGYLCSYLVDNNKEINISYPCAIFSIFFENSSYKDILTLYIPLFIIFFISLFTLMIDLDDYQARISIIAQIMPTLVLFRLVIMQLAPNIEVTTKIDILYFVMIFLSLLILLFQTYIVLTMKKLKVTKNLELINETKENLEKQNYILFIIILLVLIIIQTINSIIL